jgi:hypothetical protein
MIASYRFVCAEDALHGQLSAHPIVQDSVRSECLEPTRTAFLLSRVWWRLTKGDRSFGVFTRRDVHEVWSRRRDEVIDLM